ncbi:hypothetical protein OG753_03585 [Streptomyces sp. NBC_00029]|uniref:hypothetical protein n=1 Tax=Streptomyces sp. NBC_00029 TaxID=2903613 RepID=UPI0032430701
MDSRATVTTTATGLEWQSVAAGGALHGVAALAAALQEGRWPDARHAVTDLREALFRLDALLPPARRQARTTTRI